MVWLLISAAWADIAPPPAASCSVSLCAGFEARRCTGCDLTSQGWTQQCDNGRERLFCRVAPAAGSLLPPPAGLAASLSGTPPTRARVPSDAFGVKAYGEIGVWQDGAGTWAVERVRHDNGALLQPLDPAALLPVLSAPLPVHARDDDRSLGTLQPGAPVTVADGGLIVHDGPLSITVWADDAPTFATTYPAPPDRAGAGEAMCLAPGMTLWDRPDGMVLATHPGSDCRPGWQQGATVDGWIPVQHPGLGLSAWVEASDMGLGGLIGGVGIGYGGNITLKTLDEPAWVYDARGGSIVGRMESGTFVVERSQLDGWWSASIRTSTGERTVWFPPQVTPPQ